MITLWNIILTVGGLFYLLLLGMIIYGLIRLGFQRVSPRISGNEFPSVSIIISARDEENNLPATLSGLLRQDYPVDRLEIIVVDDRSSDSTGRIISDFAKLYNRVRMIRQDTVTPGVSPKKQAIEKGIDASNGEIIITTDADCSHDPNWVSEMIAEMKPDTGMVVGQARFILPDAPPMWQKLQVLDFQSLGYASAGLALAGMPFTCSGASLAYRKRLFREVNGWNGFEKLISGDDELLLAKASSSRWKIAAAKSPATIVGTKPVSTLSELWNQRIRWGSKGLYYRPSRKIILAGVFLFLLSLSIAPLVGIFSGSWLFFLLWASIRFALDITAVILGCSVFHERFNLLTFLILEIIYPPLTVTFAIAGHFSTFRWKGQTFHSRGKR